MVDGDRKFCKRGGCEAVGSKMVENEVDHNKAIAMW